MNIDDFFLSHFFKKFLNFFSKFKRFFSLDVGMDLGTANTLIYISQKGIVLNEPSVIALCNKNSLVYAVGNSAKLMLGRTPKDITAIMPMKDGVIADFKASKEMIKSFMEIALNSKNFFLKPRVLVCVPYTSTQVERRAIYEAVESAGAKDVFLIEEPIAAAIGGGLDILNPSGRMVIDIGGGTTEIGVISLSGVVIGQSIKIAGNAFDLAILNYIRKKFLVLIGESTAEKIKHQIGAAITINPDKYMLVRGRDISSGLPKEIKITETDVVESLKEPILIIISAIKNTLENTGAQLSSDIWENGILITGGGALLPGFDEFITSTTGLKVKIAKDPLNSVINGIAYVLDNFDKFFQVTFKQD